MVLAFAGPIADVDHRHPTAVRTDQVVGRHLRQARRRGAGRIARLDCAARTPGDDVARLDEGVVLAAGIGHQRLAEGDEFVDVELVVGEQHEVLEVLGRGAGVVAQPVQRIVDPRCGEQRQRPRLAGRRLVRAVGDAVVHRREVGQVVEVAHREPALGTEAALEVIPLGEREVHGNRLSAGADLERDAVALQQQPELLAVVAPEEVGPCQRGLVGAGRSHEAEGVARIAPRHRGHANAHERIERPHRHAVVGSGDEALQRRPQVVDAAVVDRLHLREGGVGIVEAGGSDEQRERDHGIPCARRRGKGAAR